MGKKIILSAQEIKDVQTVYKFLTDNLMKIPENIMNKENSNVIVINALINLLCDISNVSRVDNKDLIGAVETICNHKNNKDILN